MLWQIDSLLGLGCLAVAGLGYLLGASWHQSDLAHGADYAEAANARLGVFQALRRFDETLSTRRWVNGEWLRIGRDERGMPFSIPTGYESRCHTLVLDATGAGKTHAGRSGVGPPPLLWGFYRDLFFCGFPPYAVLPFEQAFSSSKFQFIFFSKFKERCMGRFDTRSFSFTFAIKHR